MNKLEKEFFDALAINSFIVDTYSENCAKMIDAIYTNPFIVDKQMMAKKVITEYIITVIEKLRRKQMETIQNSFINLITKGDKDEV